MEGPLTVELEPSTSDNNTFNSPPHQYNLANIINNVPAFPAAAIPMIDIGKAVEVMTVGTITVDVISSGPMSLGSDQAM